MSIESSTPAPHVELLTMNAPERLNAFDFEMYESLIGHLERVRHDPQIRVLVLTGAGKGFCSGHFVGGAGTPGWVPEGLGRIPNNVRTMSVLSELPVLLRQLPQPVIAAVNGAAAGVGYSLALAADIAIAAQSAKFVNAFHNSGTGHELGMSYLLPRAVGSQRAAELIYTRRRVLADEAAEIGLVLKAVPDENLMDEVLSLAGEITQNMPLGISLTKQSLVLNQSAPSLSAAIELENRAVHLVQATGDFTELKNSLKDRRAADFSNQ